MQGYEGSDTKHLSVYFISSFFRLLKNFQSHAKKRLQGESVTLSLTHVKGGNSRLIDALIRKLRRQISYNAPLTKIRRNPDGRLLLCFGCKTVIADSVILALPCSTLRDVSIEEGIFPTDQLEAINTLQYGTNSKIALPIYFTAVPNLEIVFTEPFVSWFNHDYSILIFYYGGTQGIFPTQTISEIQSQLSKDLSIIKLAYPEAYFPENVDPIGISWINEEFSKGSYSNLGIDQEKIFLNVAEIVGERVKSVFRPIRNQIFFAGEHTSIDYPATLEGAVESGERVSRLVCALNSLN
jgi:monoamine oxidase